MTCKCNVRPNFGFGAKRVDFYTFGILSVSAESSRDTFGNISASAAVTPNFGGHRKQVRSSDTVSTAAKSQLCGISTRPRSWWRPSYRSNQVNCMQTGKATCWSRTQKNCFSCHTTQDCLTSAYWLDTNKCCLHIAFSDLHCVLRPTCETGMLCFADWTVGLLCRQRRCTSDIISVGPLVKLVRLLIVS